MASTLTVICDRCGDTVVEGRTLAKINAGPLRERRPVIDLCEGCASAFEGWLAGPVPTPDPSDGRIRRTRKTGPPDFLRKEQPRAS